MSKENFIHTPDEYSEYLSEIRQSDNILYNIINYQEPETLFFYGVLLVVFIFIFTLIEINYGLLIGLIFYSIVVYYFYTDKKINYVDNFNKLNTKYDYIDTNTNVIKNYPPIIDLIFYMREFKEHSISIYNDVLIQFENFLILYEACMEDINLISANYPTLIIIKNKILYTLESYNFNTDNIAYTSKIYLLKKKAQVLLNNFLEQLTLEQKKNIYYNGYNLSTKPIDNSNILPCNFLDGENEYFRNTKIYNVQDYVIL